MKKNFVIRCSNCGWKELSTGLSVDLQHLTEVKKSCAHCSGRRFKCPKCGQQAKMIRIKGNT